MPRAAESLIAGIIGLILVAFLLPAALNAVFSNLPCGTVSPTNPSASCMTTTSRSNSLLAPNSAVGQIGSSWNSSFAVLFSVLLPIIVVIGVALKLFGSFELRHNEYGTTTIQQRINPVRSAEQDAIKNELLEMHKYMSESEKDGIGQ